LLARASRFLLSYTWQQWPQAALPRNSLTSAHCVRANAIGYRASEVSDPMHPAAT